MSEPLSQSVYGIFDRRTEEAVYAGSTDKPIILRWGQHLCAAHMPAKRGRALYQYMHEQGFENFEPRVIERFGGLTTEELRAKEQKYFDEHGMPRCNMRRAVDANPVKRARAKAYYREHPSKFKGYNQVRNAKFRVTKAQDEPCTGPMDAWLKK